MITASKKSTIGLWKAVGILYLVATLDAEGIARRQNADMLLVADTITN